MLNYILTCFLEWLFLDAHLSDVIYCNGKLCAKQAGLGPQAHLLPEKDHRKQNAKFEGSRGKIMDDIYTGLLSLPIYTNEQRNNNRWMTLVSHQSKGNTLTLLLPGLSEEDG